MLLIQGLVLVNMIKSSCLKYLERLKVLIQLIRRVLAWDLLFVKGYVNRWKDGYN